MKLDEMKNFDDCMEYWHANIISTNDYLYLLHSWIKLGQLDKRTFVQVIQWLYNDYSRHDD